jgi:hypothetical protein
MKIREYIFAALLALLATAAAAQTVINPTRMQFNSPSHTTTLSDGTPEVASYQAMIFAQAADVVSGVPIQVGPVVPKSVVTVVTPATNPPTYQLTLAQTGITVPPCTVAQASCPVYTALLLAIGPNGTSARGVASESNPFSAGSTAVVPAGPANVKALQ